MHSWTNASPISAGVDQHKRSSALLLEKAKLRLVLAQDLLHHSCGQTPGGGGCVAFWDAKSRSSKQVWPEQLRGNSEWVGELTMKRTMMITASAAALLLAAARPHG